MTTSNLKLGNIMCEFKLDKNNTIALILLTLIVAFLSSPYLALADASVDGFFPKDFVRSASFTREVKSSFFSKTDKNNINKVQTAVSYKKIENKNDCKQIINSTKDSFSIPVELIECKLKASN